MAQASSLRFSGMRFFEMKYTIRFKNELHLVVLVLNRMIDRRLEAYATLRILLSLDQLTYVFQGSLNGSLAAWDLL